MGHYVAVDIIMHHYLEFIISQKSL